MNTTEIIYEQPLNERMRTFLRVEHLESQLHYHLAGESPWDSRSAIATLIEIMNLLERHDIKSDLLKEIDRYNAILSKLSQTPSVDTDMVNQILDKLHHFSDKLQHISSKITPTGPHSDLLVAVKQRQAIPGGTCEFDLPQYHVWLQQPAQLRQEVVQGFANTYAPFMQSLTFLIQLTRDSGDFQTVQAIGGVFSQSLDPQSGCQLVRVALPAHMPFFPEISGGKHCVNVRLMEINDYAKATPSHENLAFQISHCYL